MLPTHPLDLTPKGLECPFGHHPQVCPQALREGKLFVSARLALPYNMYMCDVHVHVHGHVHVHVHVPWYVAHLSFSWLQAAAARRLGRASAAPVGDHRNLGHTL